MGGLHEQLALSRGPSGNLAPVKERPVGNGLLSQAMRKPSSLDLANGHQGHGAMERARAHGTGPGRPSSSKGHSR